MTVSDEDKAVILAVLNGHEDTGWEYAGSAHVRIGCRCGWVSGRLTNRNPTSASRAHRRHVASALADVFGRNEP